MRRLREREDGDLREANRERLRLFERNKAGAVWGPPALGAARRDMGMPTSHPENGCELMEFPAAKEGDLCPIVGHHPLAL